MTFSSCALPLETFPTFPVMRAKPALSLKSPQCCQRLSLLLTLCELAGFCHFHHPVNHLLPPPSLILLDSKRPRQAGAASDVQPARTQTFTWWRSPLCWPYRSAGVASPAGTMHSHIRVHRRIGSEVDAFLICVPSLRERRRLLSRLRLQHSAMSCLST